MSDELENIERQMRAVTGVVIPGVLRGYRSGVDATYAIGHLLMATWNRENRWRYVGRAFDPSHPLMRRRSGYPHLLPFMR